MAGSASADIILDDAKWATCTNNFYNTGDGTISGADVTGDPGYEFTSSARATVDVGLGTDLYAAFVFSTVTRFFPLLAADIWHLDLKNTSAFDTQVTLQVVMVGSEDRYSTDSGLIAPGATYTFDWDLTALGETVDRFEFSTAALGPQDTMVENISTTVIPEPATQGLIIVFGGLLIIIRRTLPLFGKAS